MISSNYEEFSDYGNLTLEGDLTIQNAEELKMMIAESITKTGKLVITHKNVSEVDFSYLQLLSSTYKTCEITGKQIDINTGEEEKIKEIFERAGFIF